ncbi:hypothetical protein C4K08_0317 [Pseudomonas chlororaphis subsp. aureofaciens]|uniref:Uncharacterized protein n=1 Tax=Pseudomonas chlororaphis subsp. aureofaciens TaxID=587851 RepID=A0AAD0ZB37_9PSED|nr:hypothetical protein C4K08_0317 [Pseudomonas chlororaphis subsp. aureofaciens]AZE27127.1 hypothetical protein C4K07_0311 [Pseudomonas chlororaphis subsp. aureofaciens]
MGKGWSHEGHAPVGTGALCLALPGKTQALLAVATDGRGQVHRRT